MKYSKIHIGQRIGMLVVIKRTTKSKFNGFKWLFRCDCGKEIEKFARVARKNKSGSCGCKFKLGQLTHGMSYTRIFRIWGGILARCNNKNDCNYFRYGARGITVCKRWLKFENFYEDMKKGYGDNLSIDRVNNNKGYCKKNCRWATRRQQHRNTRRNNLLTINGETKCISDWAEDSGVNRSTLMVRIRMGWPPEKCIINKSFKPGHKFSNETDSI